MTKFVKTNLKINLQFNLIFFNGYTGSGYRIKTLPGPMKNDLFFRTSVLLKFSP